MSTLYYAGVRLDNITTAEEELRVVMDPTGTDRECLESTLTVEGVWSEFGLGSGKPLANAPTWGQRGDRLGVSLYNLRDVLSAPRQPLLYYKGNDLVHEAPQRNSAGVRYACDV